MLNVLARSVLAAIGVALGAAILAGGYRAVPSAMAGAGTSLAAGNGQPGAPSSAPAVAGVGPCAAGLTAMVAFDRAAPTIRDLSRVSTVVEVSTVTSIGSPVWNTSDGAHVALSSFWPRMLAIYTPITLDVGTAPKGRPVTTAFVLGGSVGCDRMLVDGTKSPRIGDRIAVFLGPSVTDGGEPDSVHLAPSAIWFEDPSGAIVTPTEGTLSVASFAAAVHAAVGQ